MRGTDKKSKKMKKLSGAILAGGENKRMGSDKAFIEINSKKLIDTTLDKLRIFFDDIMIVTNDRAKFAEFRDIGVVEDLVKGCGPLGGIYTGLIASSCEGVFFVGCDMPFLHIGLISRMLKMAREENFECIIPRSEKGVEPLHGIYFKKVLPRLENLLAKGRFSIRHLLNECSCKYVASRPEEWRSFVNVNTPEDLKEIKTHEGEVKGMA